MGDSELEVGSPGIGSGVRLHRFFGVHALVVPELIGQITSLLGGFFDRTAHDSFSSRNNGVEVIFNLAVRSEVVYAGYRNTGLIAFNTHVAELSAELLCFEMISLQK
ncbi:hypothetical protein NPIL_220881 [Nephila pilipes]|uniref:Uncharacterized protein n=1 Tax=Nephila pilipes TaxID=299642 RepID=A0A8X6NJH0_NEPPI|nr:hypothetical protein NPIL_220881 [Nephila pilipes]